MWQLWMAIAAAVAILVVISVALLIKKKQVSPNPILGCTIALAVVGITFSDTPLISYSFLGTSIVLSIIYGVKSSRKN